MRLNKLMKEAGQKLNLKAHMVAGVEIFAPADIEGQIGVDCARTSPALTHSITGANCSDAHTLVQISLWFC